MKFRHFFDIGDEYFLIKILDNEHGLFIQDFISGTSLTIKQPIRFRFTEMIII